MIERPSHDYFEPKYLYGSALFIALFLLLIALPIDTSRFGLLLPSQEGKGSIYGGEAFAEVRVQAKAYIVYDILEKKIISSKQAEEILPLASLTKVMTALTALHYHDKKTTVTIKDEHIDGGYDLGLKKGQVWTLDELLKYTLVFSSNDGAQAVADTLGGEKAFISQMNTYSTLLGLSLSFTDPAGLDVDGLLGGQGTALDVAKLFSIARRLHPEILESTTHDRVTVRAGKNALTGVPNTNQEIENLFGAEASKTGFTDDAGGNLGVVVDIALGHPVVIVVLGSTREGRFEDVEKLYKALLVSIK